MNIFENRDCLEAMSGLPDNCVDRQKYPHFAKPLVKRHISKSLFKK